LVVKKFRIFEVLILNIKKDTMECHSIKV